jgi:hypothetical protein
VVLLLPDPSLISSLRLGSALPGPYLWHTLFPNKIPHHKSYF